MDDIERAALRTTYDVVAESYANLLPDCSFEADVDIAMIDHFIELAPGRRILDAGCGAGRIVSHLKSLNPELRVSGVDLSEEMVRRTLARGAADDVVQGDLSRLPHTDGRFDGVLAWYSIIHFSPDDLIGPLAEFRRVLRPGGVVLVAFQAGTGRRNITRAYGHDVDMTAFRHSAEDVVEAMRAVGLETVARLERAARPVDAHPQGFVVGRRSDDSVAGVSSV
ncbi:class I SAM-dependent DNA methyltransferase [Williamsia phyllosphaerae]|nr:class I SAM-dependent methyltransferase [Williamsia phyllosphaerae]